MPIYESETITRDELFELRRQNRCQVCRGALDVFMDFDKGKAFLACRDWRRTQHEGIERLAEAPFEPNIPTRRKEMVEELGEKKTIALEKYQGVVSLTKVQAMDILRTIWPEAPDVEVIKAGMLCAQYGLNPLMKHVALIKFKRRNKKGEVIGEDWVTVMEISANRLIARRRHNYSFLDLTPRRMTEEEQTKINGEVDNSKVWALTHLKDVETSAETFGVGFWPLDEKVHGEEKGNTPLNMAKIRSERQALNRLYPAEMPHGIEVMEAKYIEGDFTLLPEGGGAKVAASAEESKEKTQAAVAPPTEDKTQKPAVAPPPAEEKVVGEGFSIDLAWLDNALKEIKWSEDTAKSWLAKEFKIDTRGDLKRDVLPRLTRERAEKFTEEVQKRLGTKQMDLWS